MATFPSLEPASRSISFGDYPQLVYTGTSGATIRFLQGSDRINQILILSYTYLSESDMYLVLNHYNSQEGTLIPFDLPSVVWSGFTTAPIGVEYQWRYSKELAIEQAAPISYNVTAELISEIAP
jgi:hypothetical protein